MKHQGLLEEHRDRGPAQDAFRHAAFEQPVDAGPRLRRQGEEIRGELLHLGQDFLDGIPDRHERPGATRFRHARGG